jgi:hypothetical protein
MIVPVRETLPIMSPNVNMPLPSFPFVCDTNPENNPHSNARNGAF